MTEKTVAMVNVVNPGTLYMNTRMPALSLAYLAAYTPDNWNKKIVDETVKPFNAYDHVGNVDVVALSGGNVCNIERTMDLIEEIEEADGVMGTETAIMVGGYVAGVDPGFFAKRVDAVGVGPGEKIFPQMLKDFEKGKLKNFYQGERTPMNDLKAPDFSGFEVVGYGKNINWPVQTSVSCDRICAFCSARFVYGQGYEAASVKKTLEDMSNIPKGDRVYFTDPNLITFSEPGRKRAKQLFKGMIPMDHPWFGSTSFAVHRYDSVLSAMRDSGAQGVLIGFDSLSPKSLKTLAGEKYNLKQGQSLIDYFVKGVRKIQEKYNIDVLGTFVVGLDGDNRQTFDNTIRVVNESGMKDAQFLPFTPLPGTKEFDKMKKAKRIFDWNYNHYDFTEVVFKPNNFSPVEMRNELARLYDESLPQMAKLYRRLGLLRDKPDQIRNAKIKTEVLDELEKRKVIEKNILSVKDEKEREKRRREEADRRARQGGH